MYEPSDVTRTEAQHLSTSVVVIGAGQAGLAAAFFLTRAGLVPGEDLLVLDAGPRTGGAWQHRWESLRLGDTHKVHDLPGMHEMGLTFADAPRDRPARDVVAAYYAMYERHHNLKVVRPARVQTVERDDHGYLLRLEPGGGLGDRVGPNPGERDRDVDSPPDPGDAGPS